MFFKVSRRDNLDRYYILSLFGCAIFLHYIHHDEDKDVFHNHPWSGLSFIFGRYREEIRGQRPRVKWFFNFLAARRHHRVELVDGPVWSLFIHFVRSNRWNVVDKSGSILAEEPWRGVGGPTSYSPG